MTFYKRSFPVVVITLALVFFWFLAEIRSSGKERIIDDVPELQFSHESGFYDDEFDLTITVPRGEIYYSLDGSIPTCESIHYESPIHIYDATSDPNVYSARDDVSTGFYSDLIAEYSYNDPEYRVPDYNVDKCCVVRAVIWYGGDSYSSVKTASYFVGYESKPGYDGMTVISIVTDPDNLFDYDDGIYVTGRTFDEYISSDWDDKRGMWWWWTSNYSARGIGSEREANVQFYDPDRKLRLSQACGVRIRGGGSRGRVSKGLNLYARKQYDGNDRFRTDFWNNGYYPSRISLSQGGDDEITKAKDYVVNEICSDMAFDTMEYIPTVVFLDGEYWGVYWLIEKYDENYIAFHYDVDKDNVIVIKDSVLEAGEEDDQDMLDEMISYCSNADLTEPENFEKVFDTYLDWDSTLDYYAAELYISRCLDWPDGNWAMWRTREIGNDKYSDGKWRWMLFDVNYGALDSWLVDYDSIEAAMSNQLFANLMSNDVFRDALLDRLSELQYDAFSPDSVDSCLRRYHMIMDEPLKKSAKRFWGDDGIEKLDSYTRNLDSFLYHRHEFIDDIADSHR